MDYILNIGLTPSSVWEDYAPSAITVEHALSRLLALNFKVLEWETCLSDTEMTLVVRAKHSGDARACAGWAAEGLWQDCIAVYNLTLDRGVLAGPRAPAWGPFDSRFFLLLDGTRLSDFTLPLAA